MLTTAGVVLMLAGLSTWSRSPDDLEARGDSGSGLPLRVQGLLTEDTTWSLSDSPVTVTGNTTVAAGVTLTIEPGVEVRFDENSTLTVNGTLDARGLPGQEITWVVAGRQVLELETPIVVELRPETTEAERKTPRVVAADLSFDAENGEIRYTLPEPALVRVRIGIRDGGPLLRTLVDWEHRTAGEHLEVWDGRDSSGTIDLGKGSDLMLVLACLPQHWERSADYAEAIRGRRKAPKFTITFPDAKETDERGVPVVEGLVPVRVTIAPDDHRWLSAMRFELGMYVDTAFVMEYEEGNNPFNYLLDTSDLDIGLHYITVNVIGYEGEIGTRSVRIYVDDDPP